MRDGVLPIPGAVRQRLPDDGQTPLLWAEGAHDSGSLVCSCFLFLSFFFPVGGRERGGLVAHIHYENGKGREEFDAMVRLEIDLR
jgi:hypothetical protein